jgi:CRP-like cAMP-binding protein
MPDERQHTPPIVKVELKRLALREFIRTDALLAKSPLLEHLDERGREVLLSAGTPKRYPAGTQIYVEGSEGDSLFMVLRGDVGLNSGKTKDAIEIGSVRRGEYFGESEVLSGGTRKCNALAVTEADVAEFPRAFLVKLFDRYPLFHASLRETNEARAQVDSELADFLNRW